MDASKAEKLRRKLICQAAASPLHQSAPRGGSKGQNKFSRPPFSPQLESSHAARRLVVERRVDPSCCMSTASAASPTMPVITVSSNDAIWANRGRLPAERDIRTCPAAAALQPCPTIAVTHGENTKAACALQRFLETHAGNSFGGFPRYTVVHLRRGLRLDSTTCGSAGMGVSSRARVRARSGAVLAR